MVDLASANISRSTTVSTTSSIYCGGTMGYSDHPVCVAEVAQELSAGRAVLDPASDARGLGRRR